MIISELQPPPAHPFYGPNWKRGLDPWHRDAFPVQFRDKFPGGERKGGWFLEDAWGNEIAYVPDGTEINSPTVSTEMTLEVK